MKNLSVIFKKYDCIVFSDEIYKEIVHPKYEFGNIKDYYSKIVRGSSLSKSVACGGYRLGWLIFDDSLNKLHKMCKVLASSIYSCPSIMLQHAAVKSLEEPEDIILQKEFQRHMFQNICEYCKDEFTSLHR